MVSVIDCLPRSAARRHHIRRITLIRWHCCGSVWLAPARATGISVYVRGQGEVDENEMNGDRSNLKFIR